MDGTPKKGNIRNINEYFEDIDSAIHHIKAEGNETLLLLGHSTGGLVASLYLDQLDRKNDDSQTPFITGLILNSPFLDMNMRWMTEKVGVPLVAGLGMVAPNYKLPIKDNGMYGRSIHHKYKGEWEYNLKWKQLSPPIYASWLKAIYAGHRKVKHGLHITQPILVLYSTQSVYGKTWQEDFRLGDAVLDVNDIEKLGKKLGKNVQTAAIQDGLHDLALSNREARKKYYKEIDKWIDKNIKNLSIYAP